MYRHSYSQSTGDTFLLRLFPGDSSCITLPKVTSYWVFMKFIFFKIDIIFFLLQYALRHRVKILFFPFSQSRKCSFWEMDSEFWHRSSWWPCFCYTAGSILPIFGKGYFNVQWQFPVWGKLVIKIWSLFPVKYFLKCLILTEIHEWY